MKNTHKSMINSPDNATEDAGYELCFEKYKNFSVPSDEPHCNSTWDSFLCWPPTRAGQVAYQPCPAENGVDSKNYAFKTCLPGGQWRNDTVQDLTDSTPCLSEEVSELLKKLYSGTIAEAQAKMEVAINTRCLELVGLGFSLAALLVSLGIFFHFRSLRNNRTRIHTNLFCAMLVQVVVRLIVYVDQAITRGGSLAASSNGKNGRGIDNTPILCEGMYVLLEYARTAMFMWMFLEGLYLHNMITVTVFQEKSYYVIYAIVGWGVPVVMTAAWALATGFYFTSTKCWWGYNFTRYFWILEGPRLGVVLLNFCFLLNIIRVLVMKLRQSRTSEIEQVRKAVRAAALLLPLLGITNIINMVAAPLERSALEFALWSYGTYFLTSFQGFFVAYLYCLNNGEVRQTIKKSVTVYMSMRRTNLPRQNSAMSSIFNGGADNCEGLRVETDQEGTPDLCRINKSPAWRTYCPKREGSDTSSCKTPATTGFEIQTDESNCDFDKNA